MNTKFSILWFEDDDGWYTTMEETLIEQIEERNFVPEIVRLKTPNIDALESVKDSNFDFILVDFALQDNSIGSDGIKKLRDADILADALFYSQAGSEALVNAMREQALEGVYISTRDEPYFTEKAKQIINKIVKRSEDVLNIRGLLMDTVSDFDSKLKASIDKYLSICDEEKRNRLNEYTFDKINTHAEDIFQKSNSLRGVDAYYTALENQMIDSSKLSMITNFIFKECYTECDEMKGFDQNYREKILKERNRLAHAKKESELGREFYFEDKNGNKIAYDSKKCSDIRYHINKYYALLDKIPNFIT